jgi:uncharacterized protein YmfQ (DUF2313 family)
MEMSMKKFDRFLLDAHTKALANMFPRGKLFDQRHKPDSNLRKILEAFAKETQRVENQIATVAEEHEIFNTTLFIEEWESAVGIPDACIPVAPTIQERRNNIIIKIQASGVATKQDFENIALLLGFVVTVTPLQDGAFPPYDVPFIPTKSPASRFIMKVVGDGIIPEVPPYDVPFTPAAIGQQSVLQCMFELLKPVNVTVLFFNT